MSPVNEWRPVFIRMSKVPVVNVNHPITTVNFNDWSNQSDEMFTDEFDIVTVVHCETIRQLHQCSRRAGFRRVDGAADVIDWKRVSNESIRFGFVHINRSRISQLG